MTPRKKTADTEQTETPVEQPPKKRSRKPRAEVAPVEETVVTEEPEATGSDADEAAATDSLGRIVVFSLGGQLYAFPIECVQEIQQLVAFTECPDPAPALVGMVNLRGVVVPLVDLRLLLALEAQPYTLETPMIICHVHGQVVAVAVDAVEDVVEMPAGCLQDPPKLHALGEKMLGVCRMDSLVFLLDPAAVLPASAVSAVGGSR